MRKLSLTFFFLFLLELILGGPGYWSFFGVLTIRKCFFILSLIFLTIYALKCELWCIRFVDFVVFAFIIFSVFIWMFFFPLIRGQSFSFAFADSSAIFLLLLYFPLGQLIRKGFINWERARNIFLVLVVAVSFSQILLWVLVAFNNDLAIPIRYATIYFFHSIGSSSEGSNIYVGYMPDGFYRVMWITSIYFLPAFCTISLKNKKYILDYLALIILFLGIFISYTRALWLGLTIWGILFFVGKILIDSDGRIGKLRFNNVAVIFFLVIVGLCIKIWGSKQGIFIERLSFLSDGDDGMSVRLYQINSLLEAWSNHPLMGQGFGSHASYIRVEDAPFSYEMVGFALLMKIGIIGVLFWVISAGLVLLYAFQIASRWGRYHWFIWWVSTCVAFISVSLTNPYLLNFVGMSVVLFLILEIDWENRRMENNFMKNDGFCI